MDEINRKLEYISEVIFESQSVIKALETASKVDKKDVSLSIDDLDSAIAVYEKHELYELCQKLKTFKDYLSIINP